MEALLAFSGALLHVKKYAFVTHHTYCAMRGRKTALVFGGNMVTGFDR